MSGTAQPSDNERDVTALPLDDERNGKRKKVYRWRIIRSQIRAQGFGFWLLRRLRGF